MSVQLERVDTNAGYKRFIQLPFLIYKNNPYWVPYLKRDELKVLQPGSNPAFEYCDAAFWLVYRDGRCRGRIGAIINRKYNEKTGEKKARFTRLEAADDEEVFHTLLSAAEDWTRERGMTCIEGPLGFSNFDAQGVLVEGYEHLPSVASVYHLPYYMKHIESAGYEKEIDWIEFRLTIGKNAVDKANRGSELIKKRYGIELMGFDNTKALLGYAGVIFEIINDSFDDLPFVNVFPENMIRFYSEKYIRYLNPEFVFMALLNGEPVGFVIGMPSLSKAMQKTKGHLFPFGFTHILKAKKNNDTIDQLLTGVKKQYQATGAGVVLMAALQNKMLEKEMQYIETTGIFETNSAAISNWKNYEHIQHKRKRCYKKLIILR